MKTQIFKPNMSGDESGGESGGTEGGAGVGG